VTELMSPDLFNDRKNQ